MSSDWMNEWMNQSMTKLYVEQPQLHWICEHFRFYPRNGFLLMDLFSHSLFISCCLNRATKDINLVSIYDYIEYLWLGLTKPGKLPLNFCNKTYMDIFISKAKDNIDRDPLFCLKFYWQTESDIVQLAYVYGLNRVYYLELSQTKGTREGHSGQEPASNKYVNK